MITVHHLNDSRSQRVLWLLEEMGLPYRLRPVDMLAGVENDPETLETLRRMGFSEAPSVADTIRSWHHGRIPATRSARGRELSAAND